MKRLVRKPSFWIALIVASFALNLFLAVATLHHHIRYNSSQDDPAQDPMSFFSFVSSPSMKADGTIVKHYQQTPESVLWRRMLQQADADRHLSANTRCDGRSDEAGRAKTKTTTETELTEVFLLPPFGFRRHIQQFVESSSWLDSNTPTGSVSLRGANAPENQEWNLRRSSSSSSSSSSQNNTKPTRTPTVSTSSSSSSSSCFLPPSTACDETRYSVIMYSRGGGGAGPTKKRLRRLVLNIMSFQSYPSVHDITVIMKSSSSHHITNNQTSDNHFLQSDRAYGSRILDWKNQGIIQLLLVSEDQKKSSTTSTRTPNIWDALAGQKESFLRPKESAILWIDGDTPKKDWNGTMFRANFRAWREQSQSLVVKQPSHITRTLPQYDEYSSGSCGPHHPGLHGTLMHRDWLCFLNHPVLDPLRKYLKQRQDYENDDWELTFHALSILWNQLGQGHILALPSPEQQSVDATAATSTATKDQSRADDPRAVMATAGTSTTSTARKRMRTIWEYFGCSCSVNVIDPLLMGSNTNNSACSQHKQVPNDQKESPSSLLDRMVGGGAGEASVFSS
jgi:hypothetical protein